MQTQLNLANYTPVNYLFNPQTGYYTKTNFQPSKTPIMRLPYQLKHTPTQVEKIKCNATLLMVSKEKFKTGSYKFITGLQETDFNNWHLGNDYEMIKGNKVTSICLFHFSQDNSQLTVYYFSRFDKENTAMRLKYANYVIPHLLQKHCINANEGVNPQLQFNLAIQ